MKHATNILWMLLISDCLGTWISNHCQAAAHSDDQEGSKANHEAYKWNAFKQGITGKL